MNIKLPSVQEVWHHCLSTLSRILHPPNMRVLKLTSSEEHLCYKAFYVPLITLSTLDARFNHRNQNTIEQSTP